MTMQRLALLALVLGGCGDLSSTTIDAPDSEACGALSHATGVSQPCVYSIPEDMDCAAIRSIRIDGVPMDAGTYGVQCGFDGHSIVWLQPRGQEHCLEWIVEACE